MRLIDADKLKEYLDTKYRFPEVRETSNSYKAFNIWIDAQPTAFNVEKVVEQLEEEREYSYANFNEYVKEVSPCLDAEYDDVFSRGLERAIEIVKQGGTDE